MSDSKVYKVLCLHGYRQDAKAFKTKSGGFRKILKNHCDFEFIDAPHLIPQGEQNPNDDKDCLSWWFSGENPLYFSSKHVSNFVKGFDESIQRVNEAFETKGPFDGILGFSQGGSLLSLICLLKHFNEFKHDFKFAIHVSAFQSLTSSHVALYDRLGDQKMNIPSLHIVGETDQVVDHIRSEELATKYYENPFIVRHSGGHTVPSQTLYRFKYLEFISSLS